VLTDSIPLYKYLLSVLHVLSNVLDTVEETKEVGDSYYPEGVCNLIEELLPETIYCRISKKST
jgi:hypothetical protein